VDKKRRGGRRVSRSHKHDDHQLTEREMDRNAIREAQWRFIYNRVIMTIVPLVNRHKLEDVLPRSSSLADKFYLLIEHLVNILFEKPIKDLQRVREDRAEAETYVAISDFVKAAVGYDIGKSSGIGLFFKSFLFTITHGLFIGKLTRRMMSEVYDWTVFFYKMRDNYYIDKNSGYIVLDETKIK